MKVKKTVFWVALVLVCFCMISMAAVLYAGTPEMSSGGFISLSPWIDCAVWGVLMAISGIVMLICRKGAKGDMQRIPQALRYPVAYLANLVGLTAVVMVMGMLWLLYPYNNPVHLPFYGYVAFLVIAYAATGFLWGRFYGGAVKFAVISWTVITAVLGILAFWRIQERWEFIGSWDRYFNGHIGFGYTERVMDSWQGQLIAWLNLPACVVMGNYEYAYYKNLGGCHSIPWDVMTYLVCLCPPAVFTLSWLAGRKLPKQKTE